MVINKIVKDNREKGKGVKHSGVFILCEICHQEVYLKRSVFTKAEKSDKKKCFFCSNECKNSKEGVSILQENMKYNYGWINPGQNPEVIRKNKEYFLKKYGSTSPFGNIEVKNKTKKTLKEKYGVDNVRQIPEVNEKIKKTIREKYGADYFFSSSLGKMTIENFIKRHGQEEGTLRYNEMREKSKVSLDKMIDLYGVKEGPKRYLKWKEGILKGFKHKDNNKSKIEKQIFEYLKEKYLEKVSHQKRIVNENTGRYFFYDICFEKAKIIIEVNGNYWHANPALYEPDEIINFPYGKVSAKEVWESDEKKKKVAIENGYKVFVVWENDDYKTLLKFLEEII